MVAIAPPISSSASIISKPKIWSLLDLPPLFVGDNLAFRAEGWQVPQVKIIGAVTYHWALVGEPQIDDFVSQQDHSVFDSTSKGITAHLLSEYQWRHMRVYRPKFQQGEQERLKPYILKRCYYYGTDKYDYKGVIMVALWCLQRKAGLNMEWWEHNSRKLWCLEFNEVVLRPWIHLVPENEPPYPTNMERSENLQLIWGTF